MWWTRKTRTDVLLETLIESQERVQRATLEAIAQFSAAVQAQSNVLAEYLKLFQSSEPPQGWRHDDEVDEERNRQELAEMGFPVNGTESEQAQWVLRNLEKL